LCSALIPGEGGSLAASSSPASSSAARWAGLGVHGCVPLPAWFSAGFLAVSQAPFCREPRAWCNPVCSGSLRCPAPSGCLGGIFF
jgi:hypothetical protein